jgi:hypothetical protein
MDSADRDPLALRRGVLAASVLHDVPMEPADGGVRVGVFWDDRDAWTPVRWPELAAALAGADPESTAGRLRLRDWLRARAWAASTVPAGPQAGTERPVDDRLVALALPVGHALHPGESWVVERVLGGVLDVGPGLLPADGGRHLWSLDDAAGLLPADGGRHLRSLDDAPGLQPSRLAAPLPPSAVPPDRLDLSGRWAALRAHLDAMAELAVARLERRGPAVLQPIGGCDALTLLSSRRMRRAVATGDGTGLRAVAVPMRSRGWFDLARIDPAFVGAAATATAPEERGVTSPLLVTVDEVAVVRHPADPARLARACLS